MFSLQFIPVHPQDCREHRKRPRLVTSCDNWCAKHHQILSCPDPLPFSSLVSSSSRAKKLKCIKSEKNTPCKSCTNSRVACNFYDRDQYFAERAAKSADARTNSTSIRRPKLLSRIRSTTSKHVADRGTDTMRWPGSSKSDNSANASPFV